MSQTQTSTNTTSRPSPVEHTSVIKWYDPIRRFGFIEPHDGRGDIWFNWLTLLQNKIAHMDEKGNFLLLPDTVVHYTYEMPTRAGKQRSVITMRLAD